MRSLKTLFTLSLVSLLWTPALSAQENEGESLLDEAVELKLSASTPRDFDRVADL